MKRHEIHPAIAPLMAEHYMESEEWWHKQATGLASVLYEVVSALDRDRMAEPEPGDTFLFGSVPASAVIAAVKENRESQNLLGQLAYAVMEGKAIEARSLAEEAYRDRIYRLNRLPEDVRPEPWELAAMLEYGETDD